MSAPQISDHVLIEAVNALQQFGNKVQAAKVLGIAHARYLVFLLEYQETHPEHDDRYRRENHAASAHPD